MAAVNGSFFRMDCPHCNGKLIVRSSKRASATTRDSYMQCEDLRCGATYKAQFALLYTLSPPATPNPRVHLPFRPQPADRYRPLAVNDDEPLEPAARNA